MDPIHSKWASLLPAPKNIIKDEWSLVTLLYLAHLNNFIISGCKKSCFSQVSLTFTLIILVAIKHITNCLTLIKILL